MDNDMTRRGAPSIHIKYGEFMAQLAAYNLMITAMKHFSDGFYQMKSLYSDADSDILYKLLNEEINTNLGYRGICGGQALDLLLCNDPELQDINPREQQELLLRTIKMKTGCLFSLSFILGWVSKGGDIEAVEDLKEAGYCFGICYQIIDDLKDIDKDVAKNKGYNNICKYYTYNDIIQLFIDNIQYFSDIMTMHRCWTGVITELYKYFITSFNKHTVERSTAVVAD
jgi:geranylgeranyl pyrophosphate synthase